MSEFCFAPGVTGKEIADALRGLSPRLAANAPVVASGGRRAAQAGEAVFASMSLLRLFGASNLDDLSSRIFGAGEPGSRRLSELAANLPLDDAPRLEKLRFFLGPATRNITFLCRRMSFEGGAPLFVAAAVDIVNSRGDRAGLMPILAPPAEAFEGAAPAGLEARRVEDLRVETLRAEASGPIRFLWRTDAKDRFVEVTAPLARVVGAAAADLVGRDFAEVARRLEGDRGERLSALAADRRTWSGVEVLWPIDGAAAAVPISLGAAPIYDPDRRFAGYRGFGLIDIGRIAARPDSGGPLFKRGDEAAGARSEAKPFAARESMRAAVSGANVIPLRPLAAAQRAPAAPAPRGGDSSRGAAALNMDSFHAVAAALGAKLADAARGLAAGDASQDAPEGAGDLAAGAAAMSIAPEQPPLAFGESREIFDALPVGMLVCRDRALIFANRFLLGLLGYANLGAAVSAGGFERILDGMPRSVQGETIEFRDGSGNPIFLSAYRHAIEWDQQKAALVTFQPRAGKAPASLEARLRRAENEASELNAILDTATDGVAVLDAQGRIVTLNRSGEALFGYDKSEVAGEPFAMLIAPESRRRAADYLEGLKSNGVASLLNDGREIMGLARRGGSIPLFMTLGRVSVGDSSDWGAESEQEVRFCALLRDMTHWKKVERELDDARREAERASALKSDFLAKVSHEIRTPLNAILGFAEVIMDERFGPIGNERYKDYLKDIHRSGALVMSLVNDLLDLSKIEAGKMDLDFALVDANRIVAECVSIMQPLASRERVVLRQSLAAGAPHVVADERSLRQIVLNLLSNAVKFNQAGGQVIVATALTDSGHVVLRIRDTGVGMSEADIEIALEPFRQLATSRPSGGTGLGLPLTKALVEANRAFFSIKSKKHEGTLVEVAFPPAWALAK